MVQSTDSYANGYVPIGNFTFKVKRRTREVAKLLGLAPREMEFLKLLTLGNGLKVIARQMDISPHTADTYRRRIFEKLGVNTATAAVGIAFAYYLGASGKQIETQRKELNNVA